MSSVRYTSKAQARAEELASLGFELCKIRKILHDELGVSPTPTTLRVWTDEKYAEERRARNRTGKHRRARERGAVGWRANTVTAGWKLDRMRELRAAGVSLRGVGVVAGIWWGERLSEGQVRSRLGGGL